MSEYLTTAITGDICGGVGYQTLKRMTGSDGFPKAKKVGRSDWYEAEALYVWLTDMADRPVKSPDRLFSGKTLQAMFKRSPTWIWLHLLKNKDRKAKAIYIRSRPYWLESEIYADKELSKYLEVSKEVV